MTDFIEYLSQGLTESHINFTEEQVIRCQKYHDLLLEWNKKINLTAIEDAKEVAVKHFIDSLLCLKYIEINNNANLIDIGTGAGFPGLPLKIFLPDLKLSLLDSLAKRCHFLSEVVAALQLQFVAVIHGRAEDQGKENELREKFSLVTARAVTALPVLAEYCLPYLKIGGCFFALKGPEIQEEVKKGEKAIKIMGGTVREIKHYQLPIINDQRSLVIIEKTCATPEKYPRRAGLPEKKPIL